MPQIYWKTDKAARSRCSSQIKSHIFFWITSDEGWRAFIHDIASWSGLSGRERFCMTSSLGGPRASLYTATFRELSIHSLTVRQTDSAQETRNKHLHILPDRHIQGFATRYCCRAELWHEKKTKLSNKSPRIWEVKIQNQMPLNEVLCSSRP